MLWNILAPESQGNPILFVFDKAMETTLFKQSFNVSGGLGYFVISYGIYGGVIYGLL